MAPFRDSAATRLLMPCLVVALLATLAVFAYESNDAEAQAGLGITKVDDVDPVLPGGTVVYDLVVSNGGTTDSGAVTVTDPVPALMTFSAAGSSAGCAVVAGVVECPVGVIPAGGSITVQLAFVVDASAPATTVTNTATATEAGDPEPMPAEGALVSDFCQDAFGFQLQIRNTTGNATDWEIIWRDRPYSSIPGLQAGPSYTHSVVPNANGLFDHVFTSTTPLAGNQSVTIFGDAPSPPGGFDCSDVEFYVIGGGDGGGGGGGGGVSFSASEDTTITPPPTPTPTPPPGESMLGIVKTDDVDPVLPGGVVVYDVVVSNSGTADSGVVTCLLYTSPSPRDATLSRMPSSA